MPRPSNEELQTELQEAVTKHNEANDVMNKCKTRIVEIQAILNDRMAIEPPKEEPTT
tara:strand:+ start:223 stop:393 length:171 start_codon:yes stop_codon:yes gene_type:complete